MQRQIKRVLIHRSPCHLHMQTLTQIYGAQHTAAFCAIPFHYWERTPSPSILHFQRGGRGEKDALKARGKVTPPDLPIIPQSQERNPLMIGWRQNSWTFIWAESLIAAGVLHLRYWSVCSFVVEQSTNYSKLKHVSKRPGKWSLSKSMSF